MPRLDPYARRDHRGVLLDLATSYALLDAEKILDYPLTVIQGIGGATASAGTHLEGRVVDLSEWDRARKLRVLKDVGFDIWWRLERPGVWGGHLHGCLVFDSLTNQRGIAPAAYRQIQSFQRGRDGLAGDSPDPTYRPNPPAVYTLQEFREDTVPPMNEVEQLRDNLVKIHHNAGEGIAHAKAADGRTVVQGAIPELRAIRASATTLLERLPKK